MAIEPTTEPSIEQTEQDSLDRIAADGRNRFQKLIDTASKSVLVLSILMGLVIGALCAWALSGMGLGVIGFLAGGALSWYHLMHRQNGWLVAGRGAHISAVVMFFLPVLFYVPALFGSAGTETAAGAGTFIGSFLGIIIWGIVFGFLALLLGVVGYLFNRKGKSKAKAAMAE